MARTHRFIFPVACVVAAVLIGATGVHVSGQGPQIDTRTFAPFGPGRPASPPDISGEWVQYNDERDTSSQAPLGDYTGIAFNAAGMQRSDTTPESLWGIPEFQCRPHSSPHQWRGLGGARILKEQNPLSRDVDVYHIQFMRSLDRPIFMDGRPHPPGYAPHTWSGFSTGEWIGNTLKITTTHLKDGFLRRGSPQTTDMYTMTEYLARHDEILTIVTVVDDPLYLDQPYSHSTTYVYDPNFTLTTENCTGSSFAENGGTDRHWVPHFLPGSNKDMLTEWITKGSDDGTPGQRGAGPENWIPLAAARGGLKSLFPEYRSTLDGSVSEASLKVPSSPSVVSPAKAIADESPRDGDVHIMPVQGNIYMLVADGTNIAVSVGPEGIGIVNTGTRQMAEKVLAAVNQLAASVAARPLPNNCFGVTCPGAWGWSSPYVNAVITEPKPAPHIAYIINTSAAPEYTGGNQRLATSGVGARNAGFGDAVERVDGAPVLAHENVLNRLDAGTPRPPAAALPTVTYFDDFYKLPTYFNGEAVFAYYAPAANTDGDSYVYFRHSEVIAAGDIFSTVSYPVIDLAKGGSIQGELHALNSILDLAAAEYRSQGGTWIIPGHGRLSDVADVASYRNMVTIVRDRIQDAIKKGMTLEQVKAARLTLEFDGRYGSMQGSVKPDVFVEAVYRSLQSKK